MAPPLREYVAQFLSDFDPLFGEQALPLKDRPLRAAMIFAKDLVITVQGGSKENPIGQVWFDALHFEILRWYYARYGMAMDENSDGHARGVVLLDGAPLAVEFPLTVSRPGSSPETKRLYFPNAIRSDEDPLSFFEAKIGIEQLTASEQTGLSSNIAAIVSRTRQLNHGFQFSDLAPAVRELVSRVMWTLDQAVTSMVTSAANRRALAMWELNLVAELSLKIFLMQNAVPVPRIHAVRAIHKTAAGAGLVPLDASLMAAFPSERNAIRFRYGEKASPPVSVTMALYDAALSVACHCASSLRRGSISVAGDAWIEIRPIGSLAHGA